MKCCDHKYYCVKTSPVYRDAYRMYCSYCGYNRQVKVPNHIRVDQVHRYIKEFTVRANSIKDFIL